MKRHLGIILLLFTFFALPAAELEAYLNPDTVLEGESFELVLSVTGSREPELLDMPKGFFRQGATHSTSINNGDRVESVGYLFAAPKAGEYTIAPLSVRIGKETVKTPELKLKVVKENISATPGAGEIVYQGSFGSRTTFYVGEEIPLMLTIAWPESVDLRMAYPKVDAGKAVFRDFRAENPKAPEFGRAHESSRIMDGKRYHAVTFPTAFRPLTPGKLAVQSSINVEQRVPDKRRARDDFFGDFFGESYKRIPRTLEATLPELTIEPLPPVPAQGIYLGLVGDYRGTAKLSATKLEVQEPLTLTLSLSGNSSFEMLQIPKLKLDGFRVYPGESEVKSGTATIRYAMIPLQSGKFPIKLDFLYFAPELGKYESINLDAMLEVTPSTRPVVASQTVEPPPENANPAPAVKAPAAPRTTLLYLKDAPGKAVSQPWYRNQLGWLILFVLAGPVFFALHAWRKKTREVQAQDGGFQRRERASGRKKNLLQEVGNAPDEMLAKVVTGSVSAYLSDRWGLPPGATPEEIAQKADNAELAEVLRQCAEASYLPAGLAKQAIPDAAKVRRVILKALRILLLVALPFGLADAAEPATWSEALACYDRSEFQAARQYFENRLKNGGGDPNALYNLGCIAEAENEPAKALWYFEKARLLAPHDSATAENCNVLRRKFFLPEYGTNASPREMLESWRDHWRPDHYLVIIAALWSLLWILAAFRKSLPRQLFWSASSIFAAILLLAAVAGISELKSTYRPDRGIVIQPNAELLSFPGTQNGRKIGTLPGGTEVKILERRQEYLHVLGSDLEGWINSHHVGEMP